MKYKDPELKEWTFSTSNPVYEGPGKGRDCKILRKYTKYTVFTENFYDITNINKENENTQYRENLSIRRTVEVSFTRWRKIVSTVRLVTTTACNNE